MARYAAKFTLNAAQQQLVTENLNLARREAWRYQRRTDMDYKTLESVAFEGLCQAAHKYDPERLNEHTGKPMKFSSIAVPYTRGAILHYIRDKTYLLRLSHKMRENWLKGRRLMQKGKGDLAICRELELSLEDWLETKAICSGPPLELKEHGAPTIVEELEEDDQTEQYLRQAEDWLDGLAEKHQRHLQDYFDSRSSHIPRSALALLYTIG